jgi:hypothetical protein
MAKLVPLVPTAAVTRSIESAVWPDLSGLHVLATASHWHARYRQKGARGRLMPSANCLDGAAVRRSFWGLP